MSNTGNTPHSYRADGAIARILAYLFNSLPHINVKKDPVIAGALAFFFGGVGLGLYFGSWKDTFYPIIACLLIFLVAPWGPGELAGIAFNCVWGVARALNTGPRPPTPPPSGGASPGNGSVATVEAFGEESGG
jgi:hypothetical protein